MRLPFGKRHQPHPDPSRPHEFRQIDDPGLAAFAVSGGGSTRWNPATVIMTDNFIRVPAPSYHSGRKAKVARLRPNQTGGRASADSQP